MQEDKLSDDSSSVSIQHGVQMVSDFTQADKFEKMLADLSSIEEVINLGHALPHQYFNLT